MHEKTCNNFTLCAIIVNNMVISCNTDDILVSRQNQPGRVKVCPPALLRTAIKLRLIGGEKAITQVFEALLNISVGTSEAFPVDRFESIESRLSTIESKLDTLLEAVAGEHADTRKVLEGNHRQNQSAVRRISEEVSGVLIDLNQTNQMNDDLRKEVESLAEGADRFLSGLQKNLSDKDTRLFLDLITTVDSESGRKVKTYEEIGEKYRVTKQAIQKRYKSLIKRCPEVEGFIDTVRNKQTEPVFSGMSPSERRKSGIDESYNYDAG